MSVRLRPLRREDGTRLLAWRNTPEVARFMYTDHEISKDEHVRWLDATLTRCDRRYWIVELDVVPVGVANLYDIDLAARRCAWAFYLADPTIRGRGVGARVEYAVLAYVFETLELNKLWCEVLATNPDVIRLHERFGFTREAHLREHVAKGDVVGLGLLAHEWPAVRAAHASLADGVSLEDMS